MAILNFNDFHSINESKTEHEKYDGESDLPVGTIIYLGRYNQYKLSVQDNDGDKIKIIQLNKNLRKVPSWMDKSQYKNNKIERPVNERKNTPSDKALWDKALRLVKGTRHGGSSYVNVKGKRYDAPNDGKGFEEFPSAYANSFAAKMYKQWGGSWKTNEDLRDWHNEEWVRIDTQGNITGPCGTMKDKDAPTRCLPKKKAQSLTKAERKATVAKKKKAGKEGKQFASNTKKAKVSNKDRKKARS